MELPSVRILLEIWLEMLLSIQQFQSFLIQHEHTHLEEKKKMTTAITVVFLWQQKALSNILIAHACF